MGTKHRKIQPGERYGKLIALYENGRDLKNHILWRFKCDCGAEKDIVGYLVTCGRNKSCGCMAYKPPINIIHGDSNTRLYRIWRAMKSRCNYKKNLNYKIYGGRGIKVCKEWESSYQAFKQWAIENGYSDELTIERIDCDKGYFPENCKWITMHDQNYNHRNTQFLTMNGETKSVCEWCYIYGIRPDILRYRLKHGYTVEDAITIPSQKPPILPEYKKGRRKKHNCGVGGE